MKVITDLFPLPCWQKRIPGSLFKSWINLKETKN